MRFRVELVRVRSFLLRFIESELGGFSGFLVFESFFRSRRIVLFFFFF